jgi:hypothetical protein
MKSAWIVTAISFISLQVAAAPTKSMEMKPIAIGKPAQVKPIETVTLPKVAPTSKAIILPGKGVNAAAPKGFEAMTTAAGQTCSVATLAEQLVRGSGKVGVNDARAALEFWGSRVSVGTCQSNLAATEGMGLIGYEVAARENFVLALIDSMNDLKRRGDYTAAQARESLDTALSKVGVAATVSSLEHCEILNKSYFN